MKKFDHLKGKFKKIFNKDSDNIYFSPGRVNLIGEHTDYNGGHVFPCALTFGTYAVVKKREDKVVRLYSENFSRMGILEFNLEDLFYNKSLSWANYPKGVIWAFDEKGYHINSGFDILFYGDIPNGVGLSSSASIEVLTGIVLNDLFNLNVDMMEIVELSKVAENKFIGVNCGIMDQFAVGMGKENYAMLLDTNTLKYNYAPVKLEGASIIIANTNKRRGLADSKYNERRTECEKALEELKVELDINSLGELKEVDFEKYSYLIKDGNRRKRAKHAIYENQRTIRAAEALAKNDIRTLGRLMNESHISLRDDYEVTGVELDTLVNLAWDQAGVIGSRMTGAGFGGCTVSLVKDDNIDDFIKNVGREYKDKIGYKATFYVAQIGEGARKLK